MKGIGILLLLPLLWACTSGDKPALQGTKKTETGATLFTKIDPLHSHVDFVNALPLDLRLNIFTYEYYYNGGGVAVGDLNNDGLDDIYFTANLGKNKLYLNKGSLSFEDITNTAGVAGKQGWTTGVTMADVNADGFLDIYVCRSGRFAPENRQNELFINNGDLTFTESAATYGLNDPAYSTQALFFDYDRDGDLDMYLLNHSIENFQGKYIKAWMAAKDPYAGDKLYRNDGQKFIDVTPGSGIETSPLGYGLGVAAGDLNNDGWPDLYVTNDYVEHDYMYINQKDGTFTEVIHEAVPHISNFSMGVDIADINNDGMDDIGVLDMVAEDNYRQKTNMASMNPAQFGQAVDYGFHYQYMFNTLQLNRGETKFSDIAQLAGVSNTDWSWTILFDDLDNDGWKDIFVTNGFRKEFGNKDFVKYRKKQMSQAMNASREVRIGVVNDLLDTLKEGKLNNYVYQNNGDLTFTKKNQDWGIIDLTFSNGAVLADLDNDGDLDMVVNNIDQQADIYRNNATDNVENSFLQIEFEGPEKNPLAVGATAEVYSGGMVQRKSNFPTRGYQSSAPPYLHFGLGRGAVIDSVKIIWPDGTTRSIKNAESNGRLKVAYQDNQGLHLPRTATPLFREVSLEKGLTYLHHENEYDDFQKEVLLPHKMSQFGPALAVADINGDSLDDVFIGGATGYPAALFVQGKAGGFTRSDNLVWERHKDFEDVGAVFFDADGDGDLDLYVVSGGNEFSKNDPLLRDRLYLNENGFFELSENNLPDIRSSGAVAMANDIDGDGDLDLFVAGRLMPGHYPYPASSQLLINEGKGRFKDVTVARAAGLMNVGMITSAVWSDYDGDGDSDLIIAGEWTSIMLFKNNNGSFEKVVQQGLEEKVGWWYGLRAADLDNDGDDDLIAGNLGLNYKYKASMGEPFKVYASDFDGNGVSDIVLGYYNDGKLYPLRGRQCSSQQIPDISNKFKSFNDFGLATLDRIYGEKELDHALHYEATTFASAVLMNEGEDNFTFNDLPSLAQLSSINDIVVDDFNGDGIKDLVIAGNLYPVEVETARNDASYGLLLEGRGGGSFVARDMIETGLDLGGDVKHLHKIRLTGGQIGIIAVLNNGPVRLLVTSN